jgi:nitric oxide reductase subunit B
VTVFIFYSFRKFGGREYWEFPPFLCIPILAAWLLLMRSYFKEWQKRERKTPLYVWMWTTGIVFFLFTFLEQNLYQIPWFREGFLRELTVQWKSNGAMVGAWNQMIYGSSLLLMVKISGDQQIARSKKAFFFYFLGLTNLMFNWGHHIYNLPTASWIRHVSYGISMTEWLFFINIIHGFRTKLSEQRKFRHLLTYRFLTASEYWVFANLCLALMMSIPAINRYTHGTHITVAHAMGTTIGINTMILLATIGYILKIDKATSKQKEYIRKGTSIANLSLILFWLSLIVAGVLKGYRTVALQMTNFQEMMVPVMKVLHVFSFAGVFLLIGLGMVALQFLKILLQYKESEPPPSVNWQSIKAETKQKLEERKTTSI